MPAWPASIATSLEAARGQGMSERQILSRVELPLAVPVLATGIRSAAIQVVATATLGAVFGFGGLGRYLVDGISQNDTGQIMGGVVLVAVLVIITELLIALHPARPDAARIAPAATSCERCASRDADPGAGQSAY